MIPIDRRHFIKRGIQAGMLTASGLYASDGNPARPASALPDIVAVRNGEPAAMLDEALRAFGGMGRFVRRGQRVCIKPNIAWNQPPEMGANTHPELVRRAIEHCLDAGAREVVVFDHTCHPWESCYRNSGIEQAVRTAGGRILHGHDEMYYQGVDIPQGKALQQVQVHEAILGADVFINMPVIKHHRATRMTNCLKNLMGAVWDRRHWHQTNLNQCIADFATYCKPTLNIVDGYRIMLQNGPIGSSPDDLRLTKTLLVGVDMVALDAASVRLFGAEVGDVTHLGLAEAAGIGTTDLASLDIRRIAL
jgi:uncharacterized protein (DUF362 family)